MAGRIEEALAEPGRSLPATAAPRADYVPTVQAGLLVSAASPLPPRDGQHTCAGRLAAAFLRGRS